IVSLAPRSAYKLPSRIQRDYDIQSCWALARLREGLSAETEARCRARDSLVEHHLECFGDLLGFCLVGLGCGDFGLDVEEICHRSLHLIRAEADFCENTTDQLLGVRLE